MTDKKIEEIKKESSASVQALASEKESDKKIAELEKQKNEYLAGWQRSRADFLNYKKEEMERIKGFLEYANEELVSKIIPILDNFEIAARLRSVNDEASARQGKESDVIQGFLQIKKQFQDFLKSQGVEEVKSVGEKFDPNFHEIIGEVSPSEASAKEGEKLESGIIVEEVQKGYKSNGRLLRPAKVKIVK